MVRNWVGVKQGNLTVLRDVGKDRHGNRLWSCVCECGAEVVKSNNALNGGAKYCSSACANEINNKARSTHGMHKSPEYSAWVGAIHRCYNSRHSSYHRYGGRGITVHPDWVDDFTAFYEYVGPRPSPQHSLDRIDNNKGYKPGNVRWATWKEQANNRVDNVKVEHNGEVRTLSEWAAHLGLTIPQIYGRYYTLKQLPPELLRTDVSRGRKPSRILTYKGCTQSLVAWSKEVGVNLTTLDYRYRNNWPPNEIINGRQRKKLNTE